MLWIVSTDSRITSDASQLKARHIYIGKVTDADVSEWNVTSISNIKFLYCISRDSLNGVFITAHIGEVSMLCGLSEIIKSDFVIANSCIWNKTNDKQILRNMIRLNSKAELWFAKQELSVESNLTIHQCSTLVDYGEFGFQTSISERLLFKNRKQGFMSALNESFVKISPILLMGE